MSSRRDGRVELWWEEGQEEGVWSVIRRKESREKKVLSPTTPRGITRGHTLATPHHVSLSHLLPLRFSSMEPNRSLFFICGECGRVCKSGRGLSQHQSVHRALPQLRRLSQDFHREYHPLLNGKYMPTFIYLSYTHSISKGAPCDYRGRFLPPGVPPVPPPPKPKDDWCHELAFFTFFSPYFS